MSLNQPSSWHHACQQQHDMVSATPARLELVPERTSEVENCTAEAWRRTQEELLWYRKLYENTPCLYLTINKDGVILSVNKFGATSLGYSPEELIQQSVVNLFAQSEQQRLSHALMMLFEDAQENEIVNLELRLNCPASQMEWVKVVARVLYPEKENPLISIVCEDITAHKLSEDALRESEQRFHTMANNAPVMLWMADSQGLCNFFNQSWLEFTGRNQEQEQGLGWLEEVHPEDKNFCTQTYEAAFNTRTKFQIEYRFKRADGEYRWILNTGVPRFTPSGNFAGYIGSAIDITERKLAEVALKESQTAIQAQLEELESLNRLKDEFLSTVSHELRTPLTNMKMAIQMLGIALNQEQNLLLEMAKPHAERSKVARYFQILNNECEREINLINNFLDLQRLDTTAKPLVLETIQVQEWLKKVVELFQARNRNCSLHNLQLRIADNLPSFICDQFSLERILIELLTNACKFSPPGAEIIIAAQSKANFMQIQVSNDGVEIPVSELPRIFDKFYRIPSNDPWKQGGTGLGLALVQKLTKYMGGTIKVESESNRTCFTMQLPLA
ncbi:MULTISPECIES: sensor histidine kinase [Fischerella]|uniref:histidine kinase n=1 Tax=Fischerella muscicola CCMEE 5323 TaxID=2019572 RepID=A0A2N6JVD1_FISMU|nr:MULTISPECIES: PAS domain-containing sensor histidine kinase [Fischerella]MBD2431421.1 PAS domain-containing sensor histidine kinase [Fischerella sp. FACHB-380]PLZ83114.1 PAS domain-containing sensor histidine kinase [Fischerella muscicola CCMEE 5323]